MAPASGLVGDSVGSSHLTPQAPLAFSVAPRGLRGCPHDPTGFGLRGDPGGGVKVVLLLCSGRDYFWKEANSVFSVFVFKGDVNPIL